VNGEPRFSRKKKQIEHHHHRRRRRRNEDRKRLTKTIIYASHEQDVRCVLLKIGIFSCCDNRKHLGMQSKKLLYAVTGG
jgi:hypothetical protein